MEAGPELNVTALADLIVFGWPAPRRSRSALRRPEQFTANISGAIRAPGLQLTLIQELWRCGLGELRSRVEAE